MAQELKYKVGDIVTLPTERPSHWAKDGRMDKFLGQTVQITSTATIFGNTGLHFKGSCPFQFLLSDLTYKTIKIMKYKLGDFLEITHKKHGHGFKIGTIVEIIDVTDQSYQVKSISDDNIDWWVEDDEVQLSKSININNKMTVNQLMKDAALVQAENLAKANNTFTTLELKTELRKTDPNFFWTQAIVSTIMSELEQEGKFTYTDNGVFRTYSLVGYLVPNTTNQPANVTATGINGVAPTITGYTGSGITGITGITGNIGSASPKTTKRISRTKALELLASNKGRFFKAVFIKKNGDERVINCQFDSTTPLGNVRVKEASLMKKFKKEGTLDNIPSRSVIRSFNINSLKSLSIKGETYKVN